jgi:hypothetical protein
MIGVAFMAFMLFTSNPFLRLANPPLNGDDLNPLLQDPGLAFHPPFLYLGYVGLSMAFSFAVAALIEGRVDAAWARWVRPWTLAAWVFLTIGIALGSWWAYYCRRPVAQCHRGGKARKPEGMDHSLGHHGLWLLADWHLYRTLGRHYIGAFLCQ